ncbi:MAG: RNA-binding protein [Fibrobacter sp.]|nr:RNA-binding protein [Fibrobacter sp.]
MENKLFIGSLPFQTTEEELQAHFNQVGTVSSVTIIKDRLSGRSKGFGFVVMENAEDMQSAIDAFDGKDFNGRDIVVNVARPREERPRRNFGGRGGGGGGRGGYGGGRPRQGGGY